jgi:cytochrome c-type biogenesis protein CcmH/NrfG
MWTSVASGGVVDANSLAVYEPQIPEKTRSKLVFSLRASCPAAVAAELKEQLTSRGVAEASVVTSGTSLSVTYRKGFPFLAVIAAAVLGIIVLAILIVSWQLFKEVASTIGPFPTGVLIFAAVAVAIILLIPLMKKSFSGGQT